MYISHVLDVQRNLSRLFNLFQLASVLLFRLPLLLDAITTSVVSCCSTLATDGAASETTCSMALGRDCAVALVALLVRWTIRSQVGVLRHGVVVVVVGIPG